MLHQKYKMKFISEENNTGLLPASRYIDTLF